MITEMVRGFDPYRAWLNVREMRRPLTAYEILELAPLEADSAAIRAAAGKKRVALDAHRDEASFEVWLQIHEELEEAIGILLDPDTKAAYDLTLQLPQHLHMGQYGPLGGVTGKAHGAAISCPRCRTANPATRKYCVSCGENFWEPCFKCATLCIVGEKYCGACGANLESSVTEQVRRFKLAFHDVEELQAASRFDDAIALLASLAKLDHPRLAEYTARAEQLSRQLAAQRQRRQIVAEDAWRRAEQRFAACDYEGAARILDEVPPPLRSQAIRELLVQTASRQKEITVLDEELHEAVRAKRVFELQPKIERLLTLKPDHAYARSVAEQVQKQSVAAAKKMLAEHRYDQALQLLNRVPVPTDTTEFQQLRRDTAELAWLARDLRTAPVVDDTLVAVAERLRRLAPDDTRSIRLCNELQRRIRLAEGEQDRQPLQWARPPEQTPFGVPVEWLAGFRRVTCAEALDRSQLLRHPGRFAVACGLALAGIKQAALRIDLLSSQRQGVLHRVTHLMRPQRTRSAWGIDLGTSGLKAVKLAWNEVKQQAVIEAATFIEHSKPLSHAINEAEEAKVVAETLKTFLNTQKIKTERVCLGLPGRMTLSRQIEVPAVDSAKAAKLVQFEAAHQFPFPLEQLAWDFQLLDASPDLDCGTETSGEKARRALLIAAKRTTTEHFVDAFRRLNLRVDVLQTDFVALHNFLAYDCFTPTGDPPAGEACPVVAALDIGCDVTNIVVSSPRSLWFRSCGVAGHSFTRALVKEFTLGIAQAEQRKRAPESAERFSDLYEALSPVFDDLLKEVQQSLTAYAQTQSARSVDRIVVVGGGFSLHGLFRHLRCGR